MRGEHLFPTATTPHTYTHTSRCPVNFKLITHTRGIWWKNVYFITTSEGVPAACFGWDISVLRASPDKYVQGCGASQIAEPEVVERNTCMLHQIYSPRYNEMNRPTRTWWIAAAARVDGCTCRTYHACRHFLPVIVEMKSAVRAGAWARGASGIGICFKLSDAVRSNSDWWKIRKTDCMGWWTAVSQINLGIRDPAELTIVSAEQLLFQTLVVILPPSRMLVRCQLRAEAPSALPSEQGYVWNDVKISRPNNKIDVSPNKTEVWSILWICLQSRSSSYATRGEHVIHQSKDEVCTAWSFPIYFSLFY